MYCTKSTVRLDEPHSLSYQPSTLTLPPLDMVRAESKTQLAGLPTMSLETIGASEYSKMPESSPSAACLKASLTSAAEASCDVCATKSVMEPSGTGTRMDMPSTLPCSSG